MTAAVPAHLALRAGPRGALVGPFLCPGSRLSELQELVHDDDHLDLGLIVDTGLATVPEEVGIARGDGRLDLVMVEVPVPAGTPLAEGARRALEFAPRSVRLFVELPREPDWEKALDVLAAAGRGAKLRTGGLRAELFPSTGEVARFIEACSARGVPFKCTAGLHQAVRRVDPDTGFPHHGYLNIVVATCRAVTGGDVQGALADDDGAALAAEALAVDDDTARAARRLFASYGSCSIDEPVADLVALGLLPEGF
jgi:hypothetical protein